MSGIMYSMKTKSQGNVMGPLLGSSKSSSDILKSSLKMLLLRYTKGIIKRLWSAVYTTKWPLLATDVLQLSSSTLIFVIDEEILFLPRAAILCHFLAILMIFLGLIMLPYPVYYGLRALRKKRKENSDVRTFKCFCWCWVEDNGSQLCIHKVQDTPLMHLPTCCNSSIQNHGDKLHVSNQCIKVHTKDRISSYLHMRFKDTSYPI